MVLVDTSVWIDHLRKGDYRILYTVTETEAVIEVVKVGRRCDVCRVPGRLANTPTQNP